jgi:hypothetical protein
MRWDILNSIEHGNPVARGSFMNEVNYLKQYICDRVEWMDKKLGYVNTDVENVTSDATQVSVWDLLGRPIYVGEEMPTLQPGMYIIRENGKTETKIITK